MPESPPIVVGVTGASGAPIALSVLRALRTAHALVSLVLSPAAQEVLTEECGVSPAEVAKLATVVYDDQDFLAPIASGSRPTRGMLIVPCSSNTLAKIALGLSDTLITRAAHVHLKEQRRLIVVPRETPLSAVQLRHMATLAELGVVVLDAAPPYYLKPKSVQDLVDYIAGKALDHLGVPHTLYRGYRTPPTSE